MKTFMQFKTTLEAKKKKSIAEETKLPTSVDYFEYLVDKDILHFKLNLPDNYY